jgi:hypothetical protein
MFNDFSSPIRYCLTRRSAKPRDLIAPGPDGDQMRQILTAAMRTPIMESWLPGGSSSLTLTSGKRSQTSSPLPIAPKNRTLDDWK